MQAKLYLLNFRWLKQDIEMQESHKILVLFWNQFSKEKKRKKCLCSKSWICSPSPAHDHLADHKSSPTKMNTYTSLYIVNIQICLSTLHIYKSVFKYNSFLKLCRQNPGVKMLEAGSWRAPRICYMYSINLKNN